MNQYTQMMENETYNYDRFDAQDESYETLIEFLNSDFRTFGEALAAIIDKKEGEKVQDYITYIKDACIINDVDIDKIASRNTLKAWFEKDSRPKKGDKSRGSMFALAFALKLTVEETKELFHKAYLDRAFNQRDYQEIIYYYGIKNNLSYKHVTNLITGIGLEDVIQEDKTIFTQKIESDIMQISADIDLINYINNHKHNLSINNRQAFFFLEQYRQYAIELVKKEIDADYDDKRYKYRDITSNDTVYEVITGQTAVGKKGTKTIKFKNNVVPSEIKVNFPQAKHFTEKTQSYEEIRKTIILLFSYWFWKKVEETAMDGDIIDDYISQLNDLLIEANLPPLYYGHPYDWLFMYCTTQEDPLDIFRGFLADIVIDNE